MIKNIVKEIVIILLLILAIVLILGIIFYDYIPTSKQVPAKVVPYSLDEETQNELKESLKVENQNIIKTYQITSSDLELYESSKDYDKGKKNPFADLTTKSTNTVSTNTTTNNTTSNATNESNETKNQTGYFNTSGK